MMKVIGIIPARWQSTRFEGKILADIAGKPMIQHVWERVKQSKLLDDVMIACDDERIFQATEKFGAKVVMTSKDHASGTDRIAEAASSTDADIIVNIQGDEPLIATSIIDDLVKVLKDDESASMATVIKVLDKSEELNDPNVVKVVIDHNHYAIYFSRATIPYNRGNGEVPYYKHLGIYAYRKDFLLSFKNLPQSSLEQAECLEQLRAIEAGCKIKTVLTGIETVGVDTPEDLKKVEEVFNAKNC